MDLNFPSFPGINNDILGDIRQNNQDSYQPTARDSIQNLSSDYLGNITGVGRYSTADRLEFPLTLGTEKHSHMIVFHIYSDIEAGIDGLSNQQLTDAREATSSIFTGNMAGAGAGAAGGFLGSRALARSGRLGRYGGIAQFLSTIGGAWGGWEAGGAATEAFSVSPEQSSALDSVANAEANIINQSAEYSEQIFEDTGRLARFGEAKVKSKDTIAMYMPQKIQQLSLLEYEQQDLSFVQNAINDWQGLAARTLITKAPSVVDSVAGLLGMNTNIDSAILAGARIAPNPRKQLLFREPISRKFEFSFNLSPRNEEESERAYQIIKRFKKYAYPTLNKTYAQGAFYNFPAEFEIEYQTVNESGEVVENDWINRIGRCALREINVDYASSGSFSTFKNGAPTNMLLSMTFEEMSLLDSNLVEQGY